MSFEDSDIKINAGCAVFVTTESLQDVSENIPDNLKVRGIYALFEIYSKRYSTDITLPYL